ncbi:MAG TPA: hypothetical protein DDX01_03655 [Holosporales bacterium]|nr:hypothetical protein [Holosporales bacterium]
MALKEEQKYLFDKQLSRFDFYINSCNTKAAFVIAFNTFVLGSILLKYDVIMSMYQNEKIRYFSAFVFILLVSCIGMSLWNVFSAVKPFLQSGDEKSANKSLFFFKSVSEMDLVDYKANVIGITDERLLDDLITQTHVLAKGASDKFSKIDKSIYWLLYFVITPIGVLYLLRVFDWIISN